MSVARARRSGSGAGGAGRRHRGLAHAPLHGVTRDELTRRADLALRDRQAQGAAAASPRSIRRMDVEFNERALHRARTQARAGRQGDRRALPADHQRRRQPHRRRRGAGCAGIIRCAARSRRRLHPGRRAVRPDGPARRIGSAPRAVRRQALAGAVDRRQPFAGPGARSGVGRSRDRCDRRHRHRAIAR